MSLRQKPRRPSGGVRKPSRLTRERIIEAGLGLVDREGSDAISMRRLSDALGVTPMALYNHVSSKRDLLRAVAEHVLGKVRFDGGRREWRGAKEELFPWLGGGCPPPTG